MPAPPGVLANDSDLEGSSLTAAKLTDPTNGTVTNFAADGSFTYTPNAGFTGVDTFTYKANDGSLDSNPVTVSIFVEPIPVSGLRVWLKSDGDVVKDANGYVSQWTDMSGNHNHAIQTTINKPIWYANQMNGKPVVRFDGVNDNLKMPTASEIGIYSGTSPRQDYEVLIVEKMTGTTFQQLLSGETSAYSMQVRDDSPTNKFYASCPVRLVSQTMDVQPQANRHLPHVLGMRLQANGTVTNMLRLDGIEGTPKTNSSPNWQDSPALTLGSLYNGGYYFNGDVAEVIIYNRLLSPAERTAVETYLGTKYNIPLAVQPNQPPTVSLSAPATGTVYATAPDTVTLNATAADSDGTVTKVEFYQGTTKLGEDTSSPFTLDWTNVAPGSYSLTAKATDDDTTVTTSSTVNIRVNAAPTVSITSPTSNAVIIGNQVTIDATAADSDGTISKVEFYQGSTKIGEDASSPYSITWTPVAGDVYAITAKAIDNDTAVTTSGAINITVWNTMDIGNVGTAIGSASYADSTFSVAGGGAAISGTADACRFVYRQVSGNCTIIARVASFNGTNGNARAGVMMRQNTDAGALSATGAYSPNVLVYYTRRTAPNASAVANSGGAAVPPYWVKMVRNGTSFSTYRSPDGVNWTQVSGSTNISMTDPILVGLAVCSAYTTSTRTATFDNVSITSP